MMPVINLTAQFVRGIKAPSSGIVEYWDASTPGLCLRVFATGNGSWSYRYRPRQGTKKNERITFGSLDALSLADARDRAARVRAEIVDGGNPQLSRRQKREAAKHALYFGTLCERFITDYAKPEKASWRDDEQRLARPRTEFGSREAASISRREFINFLDDVKRIAPVQANRIQTVLCTMLNWGVEKELLENNPIAGLKKRTKEKPSSRTLTDAEIRVLWRALDESADMAVDVAAALKLLLLCGQRPGETAGALQRELIAFHDSRQARWEIAAERMKARRSQVVPLAPMARGIFSDALARRQAEGERSGVFASRFMGRNTLARHSLSQALRRLIDRLKVEGPHAEAVETLKANPPVPHDLRRSVATNLAALGLPREDRKAVLAHVPGDVHGAVYDKYERLKEKRVALESWERHLARVLDETPTAAAVLPITAKLR
jgi:integrase